ncbi:unnamed protein product [Prunus armeniaca]|uniref:Uncharacterized protein n=1 Tax=Prunus armeniaca TaxID=36596 RepID=A0A6J5UXM0_PRUAR|nr:unnamed protein product [Prunus armeniaca]
MALFESTISLPSPNSSHFIKLTDSNYLIWLHSATLLQRQLSYCSKLIPDALAYTSLPLLPLFLACAPAFKMAFKSPSFIPTALLLSILNGMTPRLKRSMHFSKIIHGLWFLPLLLRTWLGASGFKIKSHSDDSIERFKARLVATICIVLSLAFFRDWSLSST